MQVIISAKSDRCKNNTVVGLRQSGHTSVGGAGTCRVGVRWWLVSAPVCSWCGQKPWFHQIGRTGRWDWRLDHGGALWTQQALLQQPDKENCWIHYWNSDLKNYPRTEAHGLLLSLKLTQKLKNQSFSFICNPLNFPHFVALQA